MNTFFALHKVVVTRVADFILNPIWLRCKKHIFCFTFSYYNNSKAKKHTQLLIRVCMLVIAQKEREEEELFSEQSCFPFIFVFCFRMCTCYVNCYKQLIHLFSHAARA